MNFAMESSFFLNELLRIQTTKQQSKQPNIRTNNQTSKQQPFHSPKPTDPRFCWFQARPHPFIRRFPRPEKVTFSMSDVVAPPEAGFHPKNCGNDPIRRFAYFSNGVETIN